MSNPKIKNVKVIMTEPENIRLVIVKIETSEPGLYGVGCATFTQRPSLVKLAICLLYTSPSPRDGLLSRMPSSA